VHVIESLSATTEPHANVRFVDGGTMGFGLAAEIGDGERLIAVDAADLRLAAGTVSVFTGAAMDKQLRARRGSAHEFGLADLMDLLRLETRLPAERALVTVQPANLTFGEGLTPAVAAAVPEAAARILDLLAAARWTPPAASPA